MAEQNEIYKSAYLEFKRQSVDGYYFAKAYFELEEIDMENIPTFTPIEDLDETDYLVALAIEGPSNDLFDLTDVYYQPRPENTSLIQQQFQSVMAQFNGPELLAYWHTVFLYSDSTLLQKHIFHDFGWYLKSISHDELFEFDFSKSYLPSYAKLNANSSELIKKLYEQFVNTTIVDHPFKT